MKEEVCQSILASDNAIRFVAIVGAKEGVLEFTARRDLAPTILPKYGEVMKNPGETWARVVWGIANEVGKYLGKASRIIVHYERAKLMTLKVSGKIVVLSIETEASPEILAAKVEEIVKRSFGSEREKARSER